LKKTLSDQSIDQLCQRTGKEYKQFAIELGLAVPRIDSIHLENKKLVDKARTVLKDNPCITYRDIGQAIVQVGMDRTIVYDCYTYVFFLVSLNLSVASLD